MYLKNVARSWFCLAGKGSRLENYSRCTDDDQSGGFPIAYLNCKQKMLTPLTGWLHYVITSEEDKEGGGEIAWMEGGWSLDRSIDRIRREIISFFRSLAISIGSSSWTVITDIQSILWVSGIHFIIKSGAVYLLIRNCYQPVGGRRFIVDRLEEGEIGHKRATTTCNWSRVDISHTLDYRSALQHDSHSIDLSRDMLLICSWSNLGYMLNHTARRDL